MVIFKLVAAVNCLFELTVTLYDTNQLPVLFFETLYVPLPTLVPDEIFSIISSIVSPESSIYDDSLLIVVESRSNTNSSFSCASPVAGKKRIPTPNINNVNIFSFRSPILNFSLSIHCNNGIYKYRSIYTT